MNKEIKRIEKESEVLFNQIKQMEKKGEPINEEIINKLKDKTQELMDLTVQTLKKLK